MLARMALLALTCNVDLDRSFLTENRLITFTGEESIVRQRISPSIALERMRWLQCTTKLHCHLCLLEVDFNDFFGREPHTHQASIADVTHVDAVGLRFVVGAAHRVLGCVPEDLSIALV